ncbi:hypothetical protein KAR91_72395 [Candidatus Pacearchaeota archaeon]|nr:hypothetical protein [Candidatus Pacearchaeota archaeon]
MKPAKTVERYLQDQTLFRERKNKDRGIVNLLMRKHSSLDKVVRSGEIRKETIISIVQDYATLDRLWRKSLEDNENLRGEDYDNKERLSQNKQIELGYMPGHDQDVKKLKSL